MPHRRHPAPGRSWPGHEDRLEQLVRESGAPDERFEAYLAFARELDLCLRRERLRRPRPDAYPDFSRRTKLTVMKWFRRGLSGQVLARIGRELARRPGPREEQDGTQA